MVMMEPGADENIPENPQYCDWDPLVWVEMCTEVIPSSRGADSETVAKSRATRTASQWDFTPSLANTEETWCSTVRSERKDREGIAATGQHGRVAWDRRAKFSNERGLSDPRFASYQHQATSSGQCVGIAVLQDRQLGIAFEKRHAFALRPIPPGMSELFVGGQDRKGLRQL
jgi:hypothetical protein